MSKKRNILIIPIILIIGIACFSPDTMAHSANTMDLHYYESTTTLSVWVTHGVSDPTYHNTSRLEVRINGTLELNETSLISLSSHLELSITVNHYELNVTAHDHDIINVTAICSLGGVYSKEMIVGEVHELHEAEIATAIPYAILGTIITAGIFAIPYITNRNPEKSKNKKKIKK